MSHSGKQLALPQARKGRQTCPPSTAEPSSMRSKPEACLETSTRLPRAEDRGADGPYSETWPSPQAPGSAFTAWEQ